MDLLEVNAKIVRGVAEQIARYSPGRRDDRGVEPARRDDRPRPARVRLPKQRVFGQAGVLDTARFTNNVATALDVPVSSVTTLTLGSHGDTMVPVPSACFVETAKPLFDVMPAATVEELVTRTRNGGAEVVALLKTGSAFYAPSAAAAGWPEPSSRTPLRRFRFVPGWRANTGSAVSTWASRAEIGAGGVERIVERALTDSELAALREAAEAGAGQARPTSRTFELCPGRKPHPAVGRRAVRRPRRVAGARCGAG